MRYFLNVSFAIFHYFYFMIIIFLTSGIVEIPNNSKIQGK